MVSIAQVSTPADLAAARELLTEYLAWALKIAEGRERPPTFEGVDEEVAGLPGVYAPPAGQLLLARRDGQPAGCVVLKPRSPGTGELKRLYVRPAFRGLAIGRGLVAALVESARQAGYQRLVLDSHASFVPAHTLYRSLGFCDVAAPPDYPEALKPEVVFMELALA